MPPPRGFGGCAPERIKTGGKLASLETRLRVGGRKQAWPQGTGWGKEGVQGDGVPLTGGSGGCPLTKTKLGASCHPLKPGHEWEPEARLSRRERGWEKGKEAGLCFPRPFVLNYKGH